MTCDSNCGMCVTGDQWVIIPDTVHYPNSADYGAHITVSGQIQKAWTNFDADTSCLVCIMEGSNCLASSSVSIILPGSIVDFSFPIDMPNHDITISITVKSKGVLGWSYGCSDNKSIVIKVNKYYNCIGGYCVPSFTPSSTSYSSSDACVASGCKPPVTQITYHCPGKGLACESKTDGSGEFSTSQACKDAGCTVSGGAACNDPMKWGCTAGIPNTYLAAGALMFMMMMKR